jgi:hypothetical protein
MEQGKPRLRRSTRCDFSRRARVRYPGAGIESMHQSDKREYLLPTVRAATQASNHFPTEGMHLAQVSGSPVLTRKHHDWKA